MTVCDMILRKCKCECGDGLVKSKLKGYRYRVRCKNCGRTTDYFRREFDAISAWQSGQVRSKEEASDEIQAS